MDTKQDLKQAAIAAQHKAEQLAEEAKHKAEELKERASNKAAEVAQEAKHTAAELEHKAKDKIDESKREGGLIDKLTHKAENLFKRDLDGDGKVG